MIRLRIASSFVFPAVFAATAAVAQIDDLSQGDPATLAFENAQWAEAISLYRGQLTEDPENGTILLRIAQAQREMGEHELALQSLDDSLALAGPEAMINLERARVFAAQGQTTMALGSLETADHLGLRALTLLEEAIEFDSLREERRYEVVHSNVRSRIYPCESFAASSAFDFWLGSWEVRLADGTLVGQSEVTKRDGGCSVAEDWSGTGGSRGSSINFYQPSRDQWRQIWIGSGGTMIDMAGAPDESGMQLEGTIEYTALDQVLAFRGTWERLPDGRIRQHLEEFNLAAQGWTTWFEGYYRLISGP
jgi:tetratricopeptide (TPR) repeat protein